MKKAMLAIMTVLAFAAGTSPEEAMSNMAAWWIFISPNDSAPSWLTPQIDTYVLLGSLAGLMILLSWSVISRKRQREQPVKPETNEKDEAPWRIPLNQFIEYAHKNGWIIYGKDTRHVFDLVEGLNQAGIDGTVSMWGREVPRLAMFTEDNPLVELPKEYWLSNKINTFTCVTYTENGGPDSIVIDNLEIKTERRDCSEHRRMYADIHLQREQAELWFKTDALAYKGKCEERHAKRYTGPGTEELEPDMPIHKVFEYVENETEYFRNNDDFLEFQLANEIKDKGAQGRLTVWARRHDRTEPYKGIPALIKMKQEDFDNLNWQFNYLQRADRVDKRLAYVGNTQWTHMMFDHRQIEYQWPRRK